MLGYEPGADECVASNARTVFTLLTNAVSNVTTEAASRINAALARSPVCPACGHTSAPHGALSPHVPADFRRTAQRTSWRRRSCSFCWAWMLSCPAPRAAGNTRRLANKNTHKHGHNPTPTKDNHECSHTRIRTHGIHPVQVAQLYPHRVQLVEVGFLLFHAASGVAVFVFDRYFVLERLCTRAMRVRVNVVRS